MTSKRSIKALWSKRNKSWQPAPDLKLALKMGRQLNVETIILCCIQIGNEDPPAGRYGVYFINVKTKKTTYAANMTPDVEGDGFKTFKALVDQVFTDHKS